MGFFDFFKNRSKSISSQPTESESIQAPMIKEDIEVKVDEPSEPIVEQPTEIVQEASQEVESVEISKDEDSTPKKVILTKQRVLGRIIGVSREICKKRDANFDKEAYNKADFEMNILTAMVHAVTEERDTLRSLLTMYGNEWTEELEGRQIDRVFGGFESIKVIQEELDLQLLLSDTDINSIPTQKVETPTNTEEVVVEAAVTTEVAEEPKKERKKTADVVKDDETVELNRHRLIGRIHGISYAICKKRDADFDNDEFSKLDGDMRVFKACILATEDERNAILELTQLYNQAANNNFHGRDIDRVFGGFEAMAILEADLDFKLLVSDKNILRVKDRKLAEKSEPEIKVKPIEDEQPKTFQTSFSKGYCSISWGNNKRTARVSRGWKLKMFGDDYDFYMLQQSEVIKEYPGSCHNDYAKLHKDKYGRLWLQVYYSDAFDDRIERTFDYVESEAQADEYSNGAGYHYFGHNHFFFSSEQPDFILHEDTVEKEGDAEGYYKEICELNKVEP